MNSWIQYSFIDTMNEKSKNIIMLHDFIVLHLTAIIIFVFLLMLISMNNKMISNDWTELPLLEFSWTFLPGLILLSISVPSIVAMYNHETDDIYSMTMKITGHQWYWNYDYSSFNNVEFDSYTKNSAELELGEFRLLDVDNRAIIPMNMKIQFLVTSADVIHSFAIPAMSVKIDANPGYLNSTSVEFFYPSVSYGMCSEICGAGHSNMSISIESTSLYLFKNWVKTFY